MDAVRTVRKVLLWRDWPNGGSNACLVRLLEESGTYRVLTAGTGRPGKAHFDRRYGGGMESFEAAARQVDLVVRGALQQKTVGEWRVQSDLTVDASADEEAVLAALLLAPSAVNAGFLAAAASLGLASL